MILSLIVLFLCFFNGAGQVLTAEDSSRKISFEYGGLGNLLSRKRAYISQDPIRLEAGQTNLYAYIHDVNSWVDPSDIW